MEEAVAEHGTFFVPKVPVDVNGAPDDIAWRRRLLSKASVAEGRIAEAMFRKQCLQWRNELRVDAEVLAEVEPSQKCWDWHYYAALRSAVEKKEPLPPIGLALD